jgi:hypothetical protein
VRGRHPIFRYDNFHTDWLYPGHQDEHHKHLFDWKVGEQMEDSPIWIGAEKWPTLSDVINEAGDWYDAHYHELDYPNDFVPIAELRTGLQH